LIQAVKSESPMNVAAIGNSVPKKKHRLCDLVKASREAAGLSQRELGHSLGITASYVAYIESGARRPSHTLLFRLARSLPVKGQDLLVAAYPELALVMPIRPTANRQEAWRRFVALAGRYSVTRAEMAVLREISRLGKISSPNAYVWILNSIRQSLEEN
jgi:transcriptional regulator with XRE-family HTH domain